MISAERCRRSRLRVGDNPPGEPHLFIILHAKLGNIKNRGKSSFLRSCTCGKEGALGGQKRGTGGIKKSLFTSANTPPHQSCISNHLLARARIREFWVANSRLPALSARFLLSIRHFKSVGTQCLLALCLHFACTLH